MFTGRGKQLTIFFGETDQYQHQALYMAIIEMLRREGCSGATATRGTGWIAACETGPKLVLGARGGLR